MTPSSAPGRAAGPDRRRRRRTLGKPGELRCRGFEKGPAAARVVGLGAGDADRDRPAVDVGEQVSFAASDAFAAVCSDLFAGAEVAAGHRLGVQESGGRLRVPVGRMFFSILGAIAEFEHALMSERTRDGLAAARARGRTGGQRPKLTPRQVKIARQMYDETGQDGKRRYTGSSCTRSTRFGGLYLPNGSYRGAVS